MEAKEEEVEEVEKEKEEMVKRTNSRVFRNQDRRHALSRGHGN